MPRDNRIEFEQLFASMDIQRIQDEFAQATRVAAIITRPDGTPITRPSNFCRLCRDVIRKTEKGLANCFKSDALLGRINPSGPTVQPCVSAGLWDAGAAICLEGQHIASWLIGQVRDAHQTEEGILSYAREIGADEGRMLEAFREVPAMSREQFTRIADFLFSFANQLSLSLYHNLQQGRLIEQMQAAEENLKESEEKYRDIFNAGNDAIFIVQDEKGRIIDVNGAMLSMFGYGKDEVIGQHMGRFSAGLTPESQERILSIVRQAEAQGSGQVFEWQARKSSGELFWTEVSLKFSSIRMDQKIIAVVRDITQRKQTQEFMIQTEKMMSVGGLAAGMAHEINNPLAGILQNLSVLSNRLTNHEIPANLRAAEKTGISLDGLGAYMEARDIPKIMKTIADSGLRVASIVDNMLNFARKGDASFSTHLPSQILDKALALAATDYDLKKHYDFRTITIEKDYEPDLPMLPCEGAKVQQVLLNILSNGAYAMATCPECTAPRFILRLRHEPADRMIRLEIEDNGPGMDEALQKRIFEPFFTTKPPGVGTGLGLSVSYFIVTENHGGTMGVLSKPGTGTNFIIRLPYDRGAHPPAALPSISS